MTDSTEGSPWTVRTVGRAGIASLHGAFHVTGTGATTWYGFARLCETSVEVVA